MKKWMFDDQFLLTLAVEDGSKTMTRRIIPESVLIKEGIDKVTELYRREQLAKACPYKVGEIVAVAMSYSRVEKRLEKSEKAAFRERVAKAHGVDVSNVEKLAGWRNKMYVKAELMELFTKIVAVKAERIKEISNADCLKEGIMRVPERFAKKNKRYYYVDLLDQEFNFPTAVKAFKRLAETIMGCHIWAHNSFVWAIEFELTETI